MTDKSDTQNNPKTQPLYFMTWDEVEEGQEVWLFSKANNLGDLLYKKIEGDLFYQTEEETWARSMGSNSDYKFLPVPQDRPKPNIWDEYIGGVLTDDPKFDFWSMECSVIRIYKRWVMKFPTAFRALAAWINHVLDGE